MGEGRLLGEGQEGGKKLVQTFISGSIQWHKGEKLQGCLNVPSENGVCLEKKKRRLHSAEFI